MIWRLRCSARLESGKSRISLPRRGCEAPTLLRALLREVAFRELLCESPWHARDPIAAEAGKWRWPTDLIKAGERRVTVKGWERTKKLRGRVVGGGSSTSLW